MKYTAVYNTETMKAVEYSFSAINDEKAKEFAMNKFSAKNMVIVNHEDDWYIRIGDRRATNAIERIYDRRHNIIK